MTKTIVLSEAKQTVLATLYVAGIREVWIQEYDMVLIKEDYHLGVRKTAVKNFKYAGEDFSFYELRDFGFTHRLDELILKYCPKYHYLLDQISVKDEED